MFAVLETSQTAQFCVNALAVLGGFLAGWVITSLLANSIDRVSPKKAPPFLHRSVRLLGGIALATLIAFVVFSHGHGWTLLGGGASGDGDHKSDGAPTQLINAEVKPTPPPVPTPEPAQPRIRITILGGSDVKAERFYVLGDDPTPRSLAEVKEQLKRIEASPMVEVRMAERNRLAAEHPAVVLLLQALRKDLKLNAILPTEP